MSGLSRIFFGRVFTGRVFTGRIFSGLDGLILLGLAGLYLKLSLSGDYWMYLNPKFEPLSLTAAGLLALLGIMWLRLAATRASARANPARTLILVAFLVLGYSGAGESLFDSPLGTSGLGTESADTLQAEDSASRIELNGKEYVKINTGELQNLLKTDRQQVLNGRFVMRGTVVSGETLKGLGEFGLFRISIFCCFADATAVGVRVRGDLPKDLKPGGWVQVFGHMEPATGPPEVRGLQVKGMFMTMLEPDHVLIAERIIPLPDPGPEAFSFEWRASEPFSY